MILSSVFCVLSLFIIILTICLYFFLCCVCASSFVFSWPFIVYLFLLYFLVLIFPCFIYFCILQLFFPVLFIFIQQIICIISFMAYHYVLCGVFCSAKVTCYVWFIFFCSCILCSTYVIWFSWHLLWHHFHTFQYIVSFPICHSVLWDILVFPAYISSFILFLILSIAFPLRFFFHFDLLVVVESRSQKRDFFIDLLQIFRIEIPFGKSYIWNLLSEHTRLQGWDCPEQVIMMPQRQISEDFIYRELSNI